MKERPHEQESFGQAEGDEWTEEGDQREENCSIAKFSENKSIGKENCGRAIENRADLTKLTNVTGRRTNGRDVLVKG